MGGDDFWNLLGLGAAEREVYAIVLEAAPTDLATVAATADRPVDEVAAVVERLVALHLIRGHDGGLDVLEPGAALTALIRGRQAVLELGAAEVDGLSARYRAARRGSEAHLLVEIVTGRDAIVSQLVTLLALAETSVHSISTPPYVADLDPEVDGATVAMLARGVEFRSLYDASVLQSGPHVENIAMMIERGEQARSLPSMTTKLIVIDGTTAVMPMDPTSADTPPQMVIVRPSPVTEALAALFERYWQLATPVSFDPVGRRPAQGLLRDRRLLQLLANGMSDAAIGRHLRISDRTLRRRIAQLQLDLAANSRFQLGMIAAQRGLAGTSVDPRRTGPDAGP